MCCSEEQSESVWYSMRAIGSGQGVAAAVALLEKQRREASISNTSTVLANRKRVEPEPDTRSSGLRKESSFNSRTELQRRVNNCSADSLEPVAVVSSSSEEEVSDETDSSEEEEEEEEEEEDEEEDDDDDDEGRAHVVNATSGLEPISEEDQQRLTIGGDESSPDDESTLKCGTAWSGTDSAHSSTSELSSSASAASAEDHAQVDADFQWICKTPHPTTSQDLPSQPPQNTEMMANKKHPIPTSPMTLPSNSTNNFSKPPKTAAKAKLVLRKKEGCSEQEYNSQQSDCRKTPVHFDTMDNLNNDNNKSTQRESDMLDFSDAGYLDPTNHNKSGNLSRLPPAFDKTGSLDRRKKTSNRASRDQKCRSSILTQSHSPSRNSNSHSKHYDSNSSLCYDYQPPRCSASNTCSCSYRQEQEYSNFLDHHERYGSSGLLSHSRHCLIGSQHELNHCCNYATPPACPMHVSSCWQCNNRWRSYKGGDVEERIKRLEGDKEQLQLQVAVLMEQVDAQSHKIADQDKLLEDRKRQLVGTEDLLQREMLSHSSLETQKLELLSVMSDLKLQLAALDRDNMELRRRHQHKSPGRVIGSPTPSPVSDNGPRRQSNQHNSLEDLKENLLPPKIPPSSGYHHYASLPRQRVNGSAIGMGGSVTPVIQNIPGVRKGVAFGKGISSYLQFHNVAASKKQGDRCYSTPNLAETESVVIVDRIDGPEHYEEEGEEDDLTTSLSSQPSPLQFNKTKGIKKIFGKMKRSGSGNLDDLSGEGEFRRGGVRATAGPRLGWTSTPQTTPAKSEELRLPFVEWDTNTICAWLQEMGLECYTNDARHWVKSGAQLLAASAHEIDKELGIKNPLHRKKLQLALLSHQANVTAVDPDLKFASQLDTAWVLRWLDDTGLPQHKEAFLAARVDGRVLHRLTMDDLATLHVSSHLHVASLRRGIQVLRSQGFEPDCLQRRSIPGDPAQVLLWTNHRVMEWLRVVDLAEYAPNLRGSGVHGGLIFHEPRFTAELLACLLAIPPGKTLLRRHLNTHFKDLLGKDCIQEKREAEATLGYIPLTPTTKLKVVKKSQFTLKRKKSRSELEFGDLVCPLDPTKSDDAESSPKGRGCLSGN